MTALRALWCRLFGSFKGRRRDADLSSEIDAHLDLLTAEHERRGASREAARLAARRDFGGVAQVKEAHRDQRGFPFLDSCVPDLRYAVRTLVKDRLVALAAVTALALGIGATTAVFTIVNAVLFSSLPFDQPDRIMWLETQDAQGRSLGVSLRDFEDWRASRTFSDMAVVFAPGMNLAGDNQLPAQYPGAFISAAGFRIIGQQQVLLGRGFREEDDQLGAPPVVLLSSGVWKSRYGEDPSIIGKVVQVSTVPATVIGITPGESGFPGNSQVWMPMSQLPPPLRQRSRASRFLAAYGRLASGVTPEQARSELAGISAELSRQYGDTNKDTSATAIPFLERAIGPQMYTLSWALAGAVAFVLLITCSNVANLFLARAAKRSREIALRLAVGATRWRIVRQLLVESALLAMMGGSVGLVLAALAVHWFDVNMQEVGRPYWMILSMDTRVFAFVAGTCALTALLFGLAPALSLSNTSVSEVLNAGGRSGANGFRMRRLTNGAIVAQVALTLVLLSGAGYTMRSFLSQYRTDPGFETSRLLTMRIQAPARKYPTRDHVMAFLRQVDERMNSVTTVEVASTTTSLPFLGIDSSQLHIEGRATSSTEPPPRVTMISVGPRYFETLGVLFVRGRSLLESDGAPGHEVAIINQRLAQLYFPSQDPIGKRVRVLFDGAPASTPFPWATIVGVAPTIRHRSLQEAQAADPVVYIPNVQHLTHRNGTLLLVRARNDPAQLTTQLRREVFAMDPDLPVDSIQTMDELLARQRWASRVYGTMFAVFAGIALVLAGVGLYAVMAYSVTQRTPEIGVRLALGAYPRQIVWVVIRRAVAHVVSGIALGLAGAVAVGRVLTTVLIQTSPTNVTTLASTVVILVVSITFACLWPIRRALGLDPVLALRYE